MGNRFKEGLRRQTSSPSDTAWKEKERDRKELEAKTQTRNLYLLHGTKNEDFYGVIKRVTREQLPDIYQGEDLSDLNFTDEEIESYSHIRVNNDGVIVVFLTDEENTRNVSLNFKFGNDLQSQYERKINEDEFVIKTREEFFEKNKTDNPKGFLDYLKHKAKATVMEGSAIEPHYSINTPGKAAAEDSLRSFHLYRDIRSIPLEKDNKPQSQDGRGA